MGYELGIWGSLVVLGYRQPENYTKLFPVGYDNESKRTASLRGAAAARRAGNYEDVL